MAATSAKEDNVLKHIQNTLAPYTTNDGSKYIREMVRSCVWSVVIHAFQPPYIHSPPDGVTDLVSCQTRNRNSILAFG